VSYNFYSQQKFTYLGLRRCYLYRFTDRRFADWN